MPQTQEYLSQMYFKINGSAPSDALKNLVREIVVDTSLYLPDMFSIHFDDPNHSWIDSPDLAIGKTVEISGKALGETGVTPLMKGEIVAIEPDFTQAAGMTVVIRGYDKSHRLHRGKKTRPFVNKTDSDIVTEIANSYGLDIDVESSSVVYDHVIQDNRTDMEFIYDRARKAGYLAYVENGKFVFHRPSSESSTASLEWGGNLTNFQARLTSAGQVNSSEIHGWDIKQKAAITGNQASPTGTPTVDGKTHGGELASQALGIK